MLGVRYNHDPAADRLVSLMRSPLVNGSPNTRLQSGNGHYGEPCGGRNCFECATGHDLNVRRV